jgi:hypothetical protein
VRREFGLTIGATHFRRDRIGFSSLLPKSSNPGGADAILLRHLNHQHAGITIRKHSFAQIQ